MSSAKRRPFCIGLNVLSTKQAPGHMFLGFFCFVFYFVSTGQNLKMGLARIIPMPSHNNSLSTWIKEKRLPIFIFICRLIHFCVFYIRFWTPWEILTVTSWMLNDDDTVNRHTHTSVVLNELPELKLGFQQLFLPNLGKPPFSIAISDPVRSVIKVF